MASAFFFFFFFFMSVIAVAVAVAAPPPWRGGCTDELIWFSPCLSYVSCAPNNLTENATSKCCDAFSYGVNSHCWCYLLRDPSILGFPLNITRLLSLSSLCPSPSLSFDFPCSESPALPPLDSAGITSPRVTAIGSGSGSKGARRSRGRMVHGGGGGTSMGAGPLLIGSTHKSLLLALLTTLLY